MAAHPDWPVEGAAEPRTEPRTEPGYEPGSEPRLRPMSGRAEEQRNRARTGTLDPEVPVVPEEEQLVGSCFADHESRGDGGATAGPPGEEPLLEGDLIWAALSSSFGRVRLLDWTRSRSCSLHLPALSLNQLVMREEQQEEEEARVELPDDEELREQLDMHSIISSCLVEEPLLTAEQVIEEIEEMMQDPELPQSDFCVTLATDEPPGEPPAEAPSEAPSEAPAAPSILLEEVRGLSAAQLLQRLQEVEASVRRRSEELVKQLDQREELHFEKEVKNGFISTLIDVQRRQKEQRELQRRRKRQQQMGGTGAGEGGRCQEQERRTTSSRFSVELLSSAIQNSFRQTFRSSCSQKQFLTTVIPYQRNRGPPSLEDLQVLTRILEAMRDGSDKVPRLLTDYILKVLCPT